MALGCCSSIGMHSPNICYACAEQWHDLTYLLITVINVTKSGAGLVSVGQDHSWPQGPSDPHLKGLVAPGLSHSQQGERHCVPVEASVRP
jgi:hypothetical protein